MACRGRLVHYEDSTWQALVSLLGFMICEWDIHGLQRSADTLLRLSMACHRNTVQTPQDILEAFIHVEARTPPLLQNNHWSLVLYVQYLGYTL